jgi:uncharacterized protein (DUF608 family)
MVDPFKTDRRGFLKQAAAAVGASTQAGPWQVTGKDGDAHSPEQRAGTHAQADFPRRFEGRQLRMIAFPLGGVAAGSISLGGRGQLRDWEIFNRPNKGFRPRYAFPSIWAQAGSGQPVTRVLESRILPPYEGPDGLGAENVPGLNRLESATFTGAYPLAHIEFHDRTLPVRVELDAFSPFIPHDPDGSGLPVAILRYRVTNPNETSAKASIAFSIENPVQIYGSAGAGDQRSNDFHAGNKLVGLLMSNHGVPSGDPMSGSFALAAVRRAGTEVSHWSGWPKGRWWNAPLLFWDRFSENGRLDEQPDPHNAVGVLCLQSTIPQHQSVDFEFVLGWHFPNRTPEWCGWEAPPDESKTVIGNYYTTRFSDAWQAVTYAAEHLDDLENRTKLFASALHDSTLPNEVKDAASANLSTLATTTCFRTADGEFHAFEGSGDKSGCCFGNCTHVWNYETVTPHLFPTFARSLRRSAFGYSMDEAGAMHFRQLLPDGKARSTNAAADGQMGQIVHAWLDWKLSGDGDWLRGLWPSVKKALEFAWVAGGWDENRDGVMEGVQHNTYDVEFYGPNPMCGIYYLGALRAGEEMAAAVGDDASAREYRRLFEQGQSWIDANLFNGEFYAQKIRGIGLGDIAPSLRGGAGAEDTEKPEYQVGDGCLIDQLVGQYLADAGNLGALVTADHIRKTLASIYRYNGRRTLVEHDNVARTYALNDEAAVLICDYGKAVRPRIPFPYYSEVWSGLEYTLAALMISWGMVEQGIGCVRDTRLRYDGEKRNPWDEAECGHHYARAMSAWSVLIALSGFFYDGAAKSVIATPRIAHDNFKCFWATAKGWGTFAYRKRPQGVQFTIRVVAGEILCRTVEIAASGASAAARSGGVALHSSVEQRNGAEEGDARLVLRFAEAVSVPAGSDLQIEVRA